MPRIGGGYFGGVKLRLVSAIAALAVVAGLISACVPEPAPSPSPTGFATEEEAFAAAEATYRAYVDALNARREDPLSEPDPQTFLIGAALEDDIDVKREFEQSEIRIEGSTRASMFALVSADLDSHETKINVCLDSTETRVLDNTQTDVTPIDRSAMVTVEVTLVQIKSNLLIEASQTKKLNGC